MLAALLYGKEDLRIEDLAEPEPGPGEVKVAVAHNGLCGTDLHVYYGGLPVCTDTPHPLTGAVLPQIQGHEFSGVVAALGDGVTDFAVGDRVAVEPPYWCGRCDRCEEGLTHLCRLLTSHGLASNGGGLSQATVVPARMLHRLPDTLTLEQGALVEPMSVAFNGVLRSGIEAGQTGLVFGAGPIGIGVFLGLRAIGVEKVIVVEPSQARREAIEALGAVDVIDPRATDVTKEVLGRTGGRGADATVECAGVPETFAIAPLVTRARGRYVVIAVFEEAVSFNPGALMLGDGEIVGSCAYAPGVFERVIRLIGEGHYPTTGWVEHIDFEALIPEGLEALRRGERMKVLVDLP
jgi:(R,R)-butanediol dehydrogenase / meso-butanediol dehydrogenase / diacetyl reductase